MRMKTSDNGTVTVERALGANFDIGPLDRHERCNYHGRCARNAHFTVPYRQNGQTYERHACREHLYRWAHMDCRRTAINVRNALANDDQPNKYWRPVQLTHSDVPDTYPVNRQTCIALGLDNMQRVHYVSSSLRVMTIGVIENATFEHSRDPIDVSKHTLEQYIDAMEEEGPGWYARRNTDDVRELADRIAARPDAKVESGD